MLNRGTYPYYAVLAALMVAFIAFKWKFIGLPLYWDEAWVYGPAVRAMHENGASLLPNTIGPELSRGHPLLFHFLATLWTYVFGVSNASLHAFALTISSMLLIAIFHVGRSLGSPLIGLAAVLITGLNEIFLAQSAILLPEVTLALFSLLAIWAVISRSWFGYVIAATCALLTKESAVVLILAVFAWNLVSWFSDGGRSGTRLLTQRSLIILAPIVPGALFLNYQKLTFGWYFFPVHLDLMSWDIRDIHYLFKFGYRRLFEQQGMEWATLAFGLVVPLVWRRWRHWYMGLLVAFLYVAAIKVLDGKWALPPLLTLIVTLTCFGVMLFLQFIPMRRVSEPVGEFASLSMILVQGFLLFSALNFFSDRYLIFLIPVIALAFSSVLYLSLRTWHKALFPLVIIIISSILFSQIGKDDGVGDTKLSYADDIRVRQQLIHACEARAFQDSSIYGSFMDIAYMQDTQAGYLQGSSPFLHITDSIGPETSIAILSQASSEQEIDQLHAMGFKKIERFTSGRAWAGLYLRNLDQRR